MKRVPIAILCCFTIAFVLQGILKLSGIFVFEKALDWDIFTIIDSQLWLTIIYYSIIVFTTIYCFSFTFSRHLYSKYWWHYVIMLVVSFGTITVEYLTNIVMNTMLSIVFDVLFYVITPLVIYFTTPKSERLFDNHTVINTVIIITAQILLYFLYLGLNYWSVILNSIIPTTQYIMSASAVLIIQLEVYIGLVSLMFAINIFINKFIKEGKMIRPINIASDKAKEEELKKQKEKSDSKKENNKKDDKRKK